MNQYTLTALAAQQAAEVRAQAAAARRHAAARAPLEPLRVRTGWTLVGLGLRMVCRPGRGTARQPGPVSW